MSDQEKRARSTSGLVVSSKMNKSVTVLVERHERHPLYNKYVRKSTKLMAHDESNECSEGDVVQIEECRPLSKNKSWRVTRVVSKAS
jgi:small subunit ribosomal protein S17